MLFTSLTDANDGQRRPRLIQTGKLAVSYRQIGHVISGLSRPGSRLAALGWRHGHASVAAVCWARELVGSLNITSALMGYTVYAAYFQACVFWVHCVFSDSPNTQPSFESAGALHIVYCVFSIHTWRVPVYFEGGCVLRIAYCVLGAPF